MKRPCMNKGNEQTNDRMKRRDGARDRTFNAIHVIVILINWFHFGNNKRLRKWNAAFDIFDGNWNGWQWPSRRTRTPISSTIWHWTNVIAYYFRRHRVYKIQKRVNHSDFSVLLLLLHWFVCHRSSSSTSVHLNALIFAICFRFLFSFSFSFSGSLFFIARAFRSKEKKK